MEKQEFYILGPCYKTVNKAVQEIKDFVKHRIIEILSAKVKDVDRRWINEV